MAISRLADRCRKCRFVDICPNKRMEALAYLPDPVTAQATVRSSADMAAPMLRVTRLVLLYGSPSTVYVDDLDRMLRPHFIKQNFCK